MSMTLQPRGSSTWFCLLVMFHASLATPTGPWRDRFAQLQKAIEGPTDLQPEDDSFKELNLTHVNLGFGSVGRSAVKCFLRQRCRQNGVALLVEVGVWLGESVVEWLSTQKNASRKCVHVVGIDPFKAPRSTTQPVAGRLPTVIRNKLGKPAFNRALAKRVINYKVQGAADRVALLTGLAPDGLKPLFDLRPLLPVDVVYIDGGKIGKTQRYEQYLLHSLSLYSSHYPNAGLSGDDWDHPTTKASLQHILVEWARNHSLALGVASGRTWFMGASEQAWGSCDKKKQIQWVVRGPP
eukprot:scaffold55231_cov82-Phaeocystis_antarctica.AAC.3